MTHSSFFTFAQTWLDRASFARRSVDAGRQVEQQDDYEAERRCGSGQPRPSAFVPAGGPRHGLARLLVVALPPPCAGPVAFLLGDRVFFARTRRVCVLAAHYRAAAALAAPL